MQNPPGYSLSGGTSQAPQFPLENLETVCLRMDSLHNFLEQAINANTVITKDQTAVISSEIASAIHQIMINGSALVSSRTTTAVDSRNSTAGKLSADGFDSDCEIVELDAVELLAEHMHFCEICGKGFKRDANLRMHMRAHGNQYKTPEALAKPGKDDKTPGKRRFSCPFEGCNRNMRHKKFRPLKSVICVKNHFKRSHCPKMYSCNRCNKKSFSVVSDLKSHLKHCGGEARWKCSCGTSFSRKDKLFGHVGLFEGHMPLVTEDRGGGESKGKGKIGGESEGSCLESGDYERLFGGFGSIEDGFRLEDVLGSSNGCFNGGGMSFW